MLSSQRGTSGCLGDETALPRSSPRLVLSLERGASGPSPCVHLHSQPPALLLCLPLGTHVTLSPEKGFLPFCFCLTVSQPIPTGTFHLGGQILLGWGLCRLLGRDVPHRDLSYQPSYALGYIWGPLTFLWKSKRYLWSTVKNPWLN